MTRQDAIGQVAERYVEAGKFAGMEWLVEQGGETLSRGSAGVAHVASGRAIPDGAIYRIYSMTKPIVSVMALKLIEQGKLRLYDALVQYDPRFARMRVLSPDGSLAPAARPILVEDLITHRAGFTYEFLAGCHVAPYYRASNISSDGECSLDEMMGRLAEQPLAFQPGSQFRYSVATDALAHVVERAAGQTIDELLEAQIFRPLGMRDTGYRVEAASRDRLMPMYGIGEFLDLPPLDIHDQPLEEVDVEEMYPSDSSEFRRGGHGLFSTLDDYAAFARMLLSGRSDDGEVILSRKMLAMMTSNRIPASQLPLRIGLNALPGYGWGLGVRVMLDVGQSLALTSDGEHGWAGAASTYFWVDPQENLTGTFMTQYLGSAVPLSDDMRTAAYQVL